ncbi:MAG TPA: R3H domain-containing nucleic acid-binding protein [Candidatus Saccharimonadales bacterium]
MMGDPITYAKQYLEDLLTFFGLNVDVQASHEDEVIELSIPSTHLNGFLIGQRGETLRSIQFLVSSALKNQEFDLNRVNVDVADYKRHRRERLARQAEQWIEEVKTSGQAMPLSPMNAADRRVVHKTVSDYGGVESESDGEGRDRHVVIKPTSNDSTAGPDATEKSED